MGTEKESTTNTNDKTNTEELMMADTILPATTIHSYDSTMEVKTLKDLKKTPETVASKITIHITDLNPSPPFQIVSTYALTQLFLSSRAEHNYPQLAAISKFSGNPVFR